MSTISVHTKPFLFELLTNALPDVYQAYPRLRGLGGVVRDASGVILLARHDDILKTFADRRFTSVGRQSMARAAPALHQTMEASGLFDLLNFRDDETHRQSRRVLAGLFNAEAMEQIRAAVAAEADVLLARWASGQAENLVPAVIPPLAGARAGHADRPRRGGVDAFPAADAPLRRLAVGRGARRSRAGPGDRRVRVGPALAGATARRPLDPAGCGSPGKPAGSCWAMCCWC